MRSWARVWVCVGGLTTLRRPPPSPPHARSTSPPHPRPKKKNSTKKNTHQTCRLEQLKNTTFEFVHAPGQADATAARIAVDEGAALLTEDSDFVVDVAIAAGNDAAVLKNVSALLGFFR